MAEMANLQLQALVVDDRVELLRLGRVSQAMNPKVEAVFDPLELGTATQTYFFFQHFVGWLPDSIRADLFGDRARLQSAFDGWLGAVEQCPGGLVYREAKWQLMRDPGMPITPSTEPDFHHLVLLPYVDVFFADKRTVQALNIAPGIPKDVKTRCIRNSEFETWLKGL